MTSTPDSRPFDPVKEVERLKAIADELHRLADEATERYRAALARIEPEPPLLDAIKKGK
jgi:5-enolpyruvylshikimate-3-phosphate synthase